MKPAEGTPRTEAFIAALELEHVDIWQALKRFKEFARDLERELQQSGAELYRVKQVELPELIGIWKQRAEAAEAKLITIEKLDAAIDAINPDMVICPNCVHQFRAIPVNVQHKLVAAEAKVAELIEQHQITEQGIADLKQNIDDLDAENADLKRRLEEAERELFHKEHPF